MKDIIKKETEKRRAKVQQIIVNSHADACIIATSVNQYYLVDFVFDGYIYVGTEGEPILFVRRPAGIKGENVIYIRKPEQIPGFLQQRNISLPRKLMFESDTLPYSTASRLLAALKNPEPINVSDKMRRVRSIKSEYELGIMRECARIHALVYEQIPDIYRRGMTDIEFQIELERRMRLAGSIGIYRSFGENMDAFMGTVLAGDNAQAASPFDFALGGKGLSPLLPIGANGTPLTPGTTLMVDMAGNYKTYMDDITRSFAIEHAPELAYKAHRVSIEIHNAVAETAKAGTPCAEIYLIAEKMAKENNLVGYFMGTEQQAKFVGHGVGLEINEPPVLMSRSGEILETGMAIAVEPKFVLPGIGAVGIENTYVVHDNTLEKITICDESLIVL